MGYVDSSGNLVISNQFDSVAPFVEGMAHVHFENQVGYSTEPAASPLTRISMVQEISMATWQPSAPTMAGASSIRPERLSSSHASRRRTPTVSQVGSPAFAPAANAASSITRANS